MSTDATSSSISDSRRERWSGLPALAAELVARRPAVIATFGDATGLAAQAATSTIPNRRHVGGSRQGEACLEHGASRRKHNRCQRHGDQSSTRSASSSFPRCFASEAGFCFSPMRRHIARLETGSQRNGASAWPHARGGDCQSSRRHRPRAPGCALAGRCRRECAVFGIPVRSAGADHRAHRGTRDAGDLPMARNLGRGRPDGIRATPPRRLPPGHRPCRGRSFEALSREMSRLNSRPDLHSVSTSRLPRRSASRSRRPSSPAPTRWSNEETGVRHTRNFICMPRAGVSLRGAEGMAARISDPWLPR